MVRTLKPLPSDAVADYQLGGAYDPPAGTNVVVRDSTAAPALGLYNICYVNGFQTQPGVAWPPRLLVKNSKGKPLVDPDWPDEHLFDISSEKLRTAVLERLAVTVADCARAGFDAVEFDNLDSFTRSKGALKHNDAVAFAKLLVRAAHKQGLAAGQKNTPSFRTGSESRSDLTSRYPRSAIATASAPHTRGSTATRSSTSNMSMIFVHLLPISAGIPQRLVTPFFEIVLSSPRRAQATATIIALSIGASGNSLVRPMPRSARAEQPVILVLAEEIRIVFGGGGNDA